MGQELTAVTWRAKGRNVLVGTDTEGFFFFFFAYHEACRILVLYPGMEPMTPAVEAHSLNHWTTREIPTEGSESSKVTNCLTLQGRMNFQL